MNILRDFSAPITAIDGTPIRPGASVEAMTRAINRIAAELLPETQQKLAEAINAELGKPLTLADVAVTALTAALPDEQSLPMPERFARMELARKVWQGGHVEITTEDRDRIKGLLPRVYQGVLVPVVASELLETDPPPALAAVA